MAVTTFTLPYTGTPPYFSGTATSSLVPNVFPVAIDGRAYMVDQKSGKFQRGYEQRVRDSQDISTAPGEAAINPGGLWRRGQDSWHNGAGQVYADTAESKDYQFYKSKGINPWVKGQLSLFNDTKVSLTSTSTSHNLVVQDGRVYGSFNGDIKYTADPYGISATLTNVSASGGTITFTTSANHGFTAGQIVDITGVDPTAYNLTGATLATASAKTFTITNAATGTYVSGGIAVQRPTWTDCTGEPGGTCQAMATDGTKIYVAYPSDGVRQIIPSTNPAIISNTRFNTGTGSASHNYYMLGFAKGFMFGAHDQNLKQISGAGATTDRITIDDTAWQWVGVATGQNAVYAAGYSSKKSLVHKITIKTDGTLDDGVVALELPTGEVVSSISGYLGFILIGTNKGVRYCSTDAQSNLVAGQLIPTSGSVNKFASNDRFIWFTWTNYDGISSGLGRLDLSVFTSTNTPAFATDLMYTSTGTVNSVVVFDDPTSGVIKKLFTISGVGVIAEDDTRLVSSGEIETGIWRWGIPDRKFVAKIDTRSTPLVGSITSYYKLDDGDYQEAGTWNTPNDIENSFDGSDTRSIEVGFKFGLTRSATTTSIGPTFTRWMARAYVAPYRSQFFIIPILLHRSVRVRDKEYYYDVEEQQNFFDGLIESPRIITLQIGTFTHTVIVDDIAWESSDAHGNTWQFDGTLVVTLRSVEN
jgi:hypothetical protein